MTKEELIEKLDRLYVDVDEAKCEMSDVINEIRGIEDLADQAKDSTEELQDNIVELVKDIKANPIGTNAYIDQDELDALLEWKDLVDDCIKKIVNHRGASINRKVEEDDN